MIEDEQQFLDDLDELLDSNDENNEPNAFMYRDSDFSNLDNIRSRGFCFTVFNYSEHTKQNLRDLSCGTAKDKHGKGVKSRYIVWNYELCPSSNRKHIQGYVYFDAQRSIGCLKHIIARGTNCSPRIAIAKGTSQQNRTYCTKEDSADPSCVPHFEEFGDIPEQGKRTELENWCQAVVGGKRPRDAVADKDWKYLAQFVKFSSGYNRLLQVTIPKRCDPPQVFWLYGPTGCGKSRKARQWYPKAFVYPKLSKQVAYFDGYDGEEAIIFDDFRKDTLPSFDLLLNITDRYSITGAVKGSFIELNLKYIVFTAPIDWYEMFSLEVRENVNQLGRRITKTFAVDGDTLTEKTFDLEQMNVAERSNIRN